jgi:hypothetical protein
MSQFKQHVRTSNYFAVFLRNELFAYGQQELVSSRMASEAYHGAAEFMGSSERF